MVPFGPDITVFGYTEKLVIADIDVGPLFIFAISSLTVYGITLAGWASNSKFPFIGGVRSTAQMISYEICLGLSIIPVLLYYGELNLSNIVEEQAKNGWLLLPFWTNGKLSFPSAEAASGKTGASTASANYALRRLPTNTAHAPGLLGFRV